MTARRKRKLHFTNNIKLNRRQRISGEKKMSDFGYTHLENDGIIEVVTPYNKEFVAKARNLRGKWSKSKNTWIFDDSIEEYVKQALIECYGTTGENPVETCSLLVKEYTSYGYKTEVELFGKTIARAYGRDSGAKLGDNIIWISGNYGSGGSVKNWSTDVENATFEIQNFPLPRTDFFDVKKAIEEGWCEIKILKKKRKREEIEADILVCKTRLAELDNELTASAQ